LYYPLFVQESVLIPRTIVEFEQYNASKWSTIDHAFGYTNNPDFDQSESNVYPWVPETQRLRDLHANGGLQRLENLDCYKAYNTQFQTRGSLFLVTKNTSYPEPFISYLGGPWATQDWLSSTKRCEDRVYSSYSAETACTHPEIWRIEDMEIAYCLSEILPERCRVQFSLPLAIIVVFINAVKAICMVTMLLRLDEKMKDPPIMNLGDTITSYLEHSDTYTKNMGLTTLDDLRLANNMSQRWDTRAREFKGKRRLRFKAASRTRWVLTCFLYVCPHTSL
jgi:hypothetical protein